ncbi:MAG: hypothetical protein ACK41Z_09925 [Sediminibacterium sp.]
MTPQEQIIKKLKESIKDIEVYSLNSKSIRVDISVNNLSVRNQKTSEVLALFPGSTVTKERPHDVKIPSGFTILVKPAKGAKKTGSSAFYGLLEKIDLSAFKLNSFSGISSEFASGKLVTNIKESSDVKCVSDLNEEIVKASKGSLEGITIKIHGFTFTNVIGCIPVTNGEPKADVVLVCKRNGELVPDCFMSYKMGSSAKDFQNYSGLSEKSSSYIFNHPETLTFYQTLSTLSASGVKEDVFQIIKDHKIIGLSVWGMDFGSSKFGINNCHFIAQGDPSISGTTLKYTHSQKNGDFNFEKEYQPVFGARYASGRGNKGPGGLRADNFRIGIFPRAYRSKWLK